MGKIADRAVLWFLIVSMAAMCAIVAGTMLVSFLILPAHAHDWFTGLSDPVTNYGCCTGEATKPKDVDCKAIPQDFMSNGAVTEVEGGALLQSQYGH